MTPSSLESYLHRHIPLSRAMGVTVIEAGEGGVRLGAPLEPNLNHRGTAFGGSVSSLAVLSAWALLHLRLRAAGHAARLVIQKSEFSYLKPIPAAFEASCPAPGEAAWAKFFSAFERKGRSRLTLAARVECGGGEAGLFSGDYVALRGEE